MRALFLHTRACASACRNVAGAPAAGKCHPSGGDGSKRAGCYYAMLARSHVISTQSKIAWSDMPGCQLAFSSDQASVNFPWFVLLLFICTAADINACTAHPCKQGSRALATCMDITGAANTTAGRTCSCPAASGYSLGYTEADGCMGEWPPLRFRLEPDTTSKPSHSPQTLHHPTP